jgi:hypothetical protein
VLPEGLTGAPFNSETPTPRDSETLLLRQETLVVFHWPTKQPISLEDIHPTILTQVFSSEQAWIICSSITWRTEAFHPSTLETLYPLMDKALNQLVPLQNRRPDLSRRDRRHQAQVIRYLILKEKFEDGALIARHITDGKEDEFTNKYQIILGIHPMNLEVFLYFWWKIRNINQEEYRLWISELNIYLVRYKQTREQDGQSLRL